MTIEKKKKKSAKSQLSKAFSYFLDDKAEGDEKDLEVMGKVKMKVEVGVEEDGKEGKKDSRNERFGINRGCWLARAEKQTSAVRTVNSAGSNGSVCQFSSENPEPMNRSSDCVL